MIQPLRESEENADDSDREPLYARPWFKATALVIGVAVTLVLLGLLFSPPYWRF